MQENCYGKCLSDQFFSRCVQYIDLYNAENKCNKISLDISFTTNCFSGTYFTLFSKNHSIDY